METFDNTRLDHYYVQWISVVAPVFGWHHQDSTLLRILCSNDEQEYLPKRIDIVYFIVENNTHMYTK